jgi:hypothetical protein
MKLKPVTSSQLAAIGYDPETQTLAIEFKSGGRYHYANFSPEDWAKLESAESVGSHFYRNIKPFPDRHPYTKIEMVRVTKWEHPDADDALVLEGGATETRDRAVEHFGSDHEAMKAKTEMMPRMELEDLPEFAG